MKPEAFFLYDFRHCKNLLECYPLTVETLTNVDLLPQEIICFVLQHVDFITFQGPTMILGENISARQNL